MTNSDASFKAGEFIKLILQHQPELFGTYPLNSPDNAKDVAKSVAALYQELTEQFQKQP